MTRRLLALASCLVLCLTGARCVAQEDNPADARALLAPGPHAVGFRSTWVLDAGRTYRTAWDDGITFGSTHSGRRASRPVLVLAWYPALHAEDAAASEGAVRGRPRETPRDVAGESGVGAAPHMTHGDYFAIESNDVRIGLLSFALRDHASGVFAEEVMGVPEADLDEAQRAELERARAEPTPCVRDATPEAGPFPVVVYHSGAGSSFEDNARLCEFLASHGYVVLGSAFLKADGSTLGIDGGRGSAEDAQCLLRWAHEQPFADTGHVALIGHSAGAQAFLKFAAQPGCVADALVLLDTTQDYYALATPLYEALVGEVTVGIPQLALPMLVAASPEGIFALCDQCVRADRTYLTVPHLNHDEFISQGHQRLDRIVRQAAAADDADDADRAAGQRNGETAGDGDRAADPADAAEAARASETHAAYRALCDTVLAFLDAQLRDDGAAFAARVAADAARPWTHAEPRLQSMPRGATGPAPWDPASDVPPTPRQFAHLFAEDGGVERACEVVARFQASHPDIPLYHGNMFSGSTLYDLAEHGRMDDARRLHTALKSAGLAPLGLLQFMADISRLQGKPVLAEHLLRVACELDPDDAELAASLRALEAPPPDAVH